MGLIQESDVSRLMQDQGLMDSLITGLVEDSATMDSLADDIADKVQDALEDDSDMRQRLVSAAVANEAFKRKLINKLIEELQ
ncbi:MAG: hypothetical protein J4O03_07525 [Chloroflexi bacterium]|nr:hypothetical protein [Chloroflexota bacterium]MCH8351532.1 hypothetical protein [Chloroflexota bacterium]MCI0781461.1 hypothetical protein [Chloroflexota bacterium]MCI0786006.1 hypothetical protein [Chloroflexota bacterium]MCI0793299.1 hypothetical protein [Chloroflexota bacterium]